MSIEKSVLERLSQPPLEKRQEVLDFVEFLETKSRKKGPRRSLKGLWAGLGTKNYGSGYRRGSPRNVETLNGSLLRVQSGGRPI